MTDGRSDGCSRSSASSRDGSRSVFRSSSPGRALTAPPAAVDWFAKLTVPLGMYGNDQVGDLRVAPSSTTSWSLGGATHPGQVPPRVPTTRTR